MSFLPDGKSGEWRIETYTVPHNEFMSTIYLLKTGRAVPGGTYKRLMRGSTVVMSSTPDEIRDFQHFTRQAKGSVLINGLGLGCVVKVLLEKKDITKITVIENSPDVIALVAPYFKDARLTIIQADAFTYKPDKNEFFDFVWHDIWDYICADNLPEMARLHRKYGRRTNWQDSWAKYICQIAKKRADRELKYYSSFKKR